MGLWGRGLSGVMGEGGEWGYGGGGGEWGYGRGGGKEVGDKPPHNKPPQSTYPLNPPTPVLPRLAKPIWVRGRGAQEVSVAWNDWNRPSMGMGKGPIIGYRVYYKLALTSQWSLAGDTNKRWGVW